MHTGKVNGNQFHLLPRLIASWYECLAVTICCFNCHEKGTAECWEWWRGVRVEGKGVVGILPLFAQTKLCKTFGGLFFHVSFNKKQQQQKISVALLYLSNIDVLIQIQLCSVLVAMFGWFPLPLKPPAWVGMSIWWTNSRKWQAQL